MKISIFIAVLATALIIAALLRRLQSKETTWPVKAKPVLSRAEQELYWRLVQALPEFVVLAQVQLSRMMQVQLRQGRQSWLNRISQKSADFVLCSKDLQPRVVIELDDTSHMRAEQRKRDADKDATLTAAGIAVLRISVKAVPDGEQLRTMIVAEVASADAAVPGAVVTDTESSAARRA